MDDLDRKLYKDLSLDIEIPSKCETIIKGSLKKKTKNHSILKILTTACASVLIMAGIVYAGGSVIEKIWKEPKKVVTYYGEETENKITKEERANAMTEQEARKKAEKLLKKFGHGNEKITLIELEKQTENSKLKWHIETNNQTSISFDANGEKGIYAFFHGIWEKDINEYRTTKEKAKQTAINLCKKYGYDLSEYTFVNVHSNVTELDYDKETGKEISKEIEDEAYIWYVDFCKEYDGLVDGFNEISIAFVPEINELFYFIIREGNYENNSLEITEQQAKETASKEEEKTNVKYEVKNITAELAIVSMNGDAYARTIDYKQYSKEKSRTTSDNTYTEYHTDTRIRKAWKVSIEYDVPISDIFNESFNRPDKGYVYYIDATTGEIIGGEDYNKPIMVKYENNELVEK